MRVLVVESSPGAGSALTDRLDLGRHEIVTCADTVTQAPCRGVRSPTECPLTTDVDLCVVAGEPTATPALSEMGSICAAKHRAPVVRIDPASTDDIDAAIDTAAADGHGAVTAAYEQVVRIALHEVDADLDTVVEAERTSGRVLIRIRTPEVLEGRRRSELADRARAATRAFDQFVPMIDIAVEGG